MEPGTEVFVGKLVGPLVGVLVAVDTGVFVGVLVDVFVTPNVGVLVGVLVARLVGTGVSNVLVGTADATLPPPKSSNKVFLELINHSPI